MTTNEEKSFLSAFRTSAELNAINWICWIHMSEGKKHCPSCLKLHECFVGLCCGNSLPLVVADSNIQRIVVS